MKDISAFDGRSYGVVVAGASFAGLVCAVEAARAGASVAVVDHQPVGAGQTSACATTLGALDALDAKAVIQQVHHEMVVHLVPENRRAPRPLHFALPYAFATFDYRALCLLLEARARALGVVFLRARVTGSGVGVVHTDAGAIGARMQVDAAGWRAPLASSRNPSFVRRTDLSCGLEAEVPQATSARTNGLHFWAGRGTVWPGYAWAFPAGANTRLGVLTFAEATVPGSEGRTASEGLRGALDRFMDGPGAPYWSPDGSQSWVSGRGQLPTRVMISGKPLHMHGGFIPSAPRRPVVGEVICVGDAAGHCFGLTAEGIRAALTFAVRAGQLVGSADAGRWTPDDARGMYARFVAMRSPYLTLMRWLQWWVARMGDASLRGYAEAARPWPILWFLMAQYRWAANPVPLLQNRM